VQKLQPDAADALINDLFGTAVGLSGTTAVIGSPGDMNFYGAAYIFVRGADATWTQQGAKLRPNVADGQFGLSAALSGDRLVIGGPRETSARGAVYLFERTNGLFAATPTAKWFGEATNDEFGMALALDGDRVLVGAQLVDAAGLTNAGAAYFVERQADGSWPSAGTKVLPGDPHANSQFGNAVALSGDRALIGADLDDDLAVNAGAVYVFARQADGSWTQEQKLVAPVGHANDQFGAAVSLSGDRAVIGASGENAASGAAYVFERQPSGAWTFVAKLNPPAANVAASARFGLAVVVDGDRILVGAPAATNRGVANAGAAVLFRRQADGTWDAGVAVDSSPGDVAASRSYGDSVALSGSFALVGAGSDVTGPPTPAIRSGTAYVVDVGN
jgi:hypothetical protein